MEYLFNKSLKKDFYQGENRYQIGAILPTYKKEIAEGIRHLSIESIRNRFHVIKKEFSEQELNYLTTLDGINHFALGLRNSQNEGIAVARMIRTDLETVEAEVAITIIDHYQHKGLGLFLFKCITYAAFERGIQTLIISCFDHNEGMLRLTGKIGRIIRRVRYQNTLTVYIELNEAEMKVIEKELRSCLNLFPEL